MRRDQQDWWKRWPDAAIGVPKFRRSEGGMIARSPLAAFLCLLTWAAFSFVMCIVLIGWPS